MNTGLAGKLLVLNASSILLLSACGGGGGGAAAPMTETVGGTVSGLSGTGLMLANNGGDQVAVQSDGSFTFNTRLPTGSAYDVTVAAQPTQPIQVCTISGGSGTVGMANVTGVAVSCMTSTLSLFAGNPGGPGSQDATGALASFDNPQQMTTDRDGNIYVADADNNTIRKVTPAGIVTTFAGTPGITGSADGTGAAASFNVPCAVAADTMGDLYVADIGNKIIRKISPAGVVTTFAGTAGHGGSADGTGASASFSFPEGIATDGAGNVYVADGNQTIRKITPTGVVTTLAGTAGSAGSADGTGAAARFYFPQGLATDSAGNVYVADGNHTIRKITPAGVVTTFAGLAGNTGSADGTGAAARFDLPYGVATDSNNNVYVADAGNDTIRKITPAGVVTTVAGTAGVKGSADGTGAAASFYAPNGITVDGNGNVYVADTGNDTVRKILSSGVVSTLAGTAPPGVQGSADGTGAAASFFDPFGLATDGAGNVYVSDSANNTIRKITPAGVVTTFAGRAGITGSADGTGVAASFNLPLAVATDSAGNVYVADTQNNTIRKITPAGAVTTFAGTAGVLGSADGTGAAASFNGPSGVAADGAGNVYVADGQNDTIRKITPAGVVTTLAGTAGVDGSADGTGAAARFRGPFGVATDGAGNVYVADNGNETIRKVTPAGVVTTLAGTAGVTGSTDGTGAAARFDGPIGVATDGEGNVYVADNFNGSIRKITPSGVVTTIVGQPGATGYLYGPLPGSLDSPTAVALFGTTLYATTRSAIVRVSNVP